MGEVIPFNRIVITPGITGWVCTVYEAGRVTRHSFELRDQAERFATRKRKALKSAAKKPPEERDEHTGSKDATR